MKKQIVRLTAVLLGASLGLSAEAQMLSLHVETPGTLSEAVAASGQEKYQIASLKLTGELNGTDIAYVREMAGRAPNSYATTEGILSEIDLSEVRIVEGGDSYFQYLSPVYAATDKFGSFMFYYCENLTKAILPESVTEIGQSAFFHAGLTDVVIPASVKQIGNNAFNGCYSLKSVTFSEGLESLGNLVFLGCGLERVDLPEGVKKIGNSVFFDNQQLVSVSLPSTLTEIGDEAFSNTTSLTEIHCAAVEPPVCGENCFVSQEDPGGGFSADNRSQVRAAAANTITVYVPAGSEEAYRAAEGWKDLTIVTESSAVEVVDVVSVKAYAQAGSVIVEGLQAGMPVSVYNVQGMLLKKQQADGYTMQIALPAGQVYLVKAGEQTIKVRM